MESSEDSKQSTAISALIVSQSLMIRELMRIDPMAGARLRKEFEDYVRFYAYKNSEAFPDETDTVRLVMETLCIGLPSMPEPKMDEDDK